MMRARPWLVAVAAGAGLAAAAPASLHGAPAECPAGIHAVGGGGQDDEANRYDDGLRGAGALFRPGELLVRLAPGVGRGGLRCLTTALGAIVVQGGPGGKGLAGVPGAVRLLLPPSTSVRATAKLLNGRMAESVVDWAIPNEIPEEAAPPANDPLMPLQWGLWPDATGPVGRGFTASGPVPSPVPATWLAGSTTRYSMRASQGWTAGASLPLGSGPVRVAVIDNSLTRHRDLESVVSQDGSRRVGGGLSGDFTVGIINPRGSWSATIDGIAGCDIPVGASTDAIAGFLRRRAEVDCMKRGDISTTIVTINARSGRFALGTPGAAGPAETPPINVPDINPGSLRDEAGRNAAAATLNAFDAEVKAALLASTAFSRIGPDNLTVSWVPQRSSCPFGACLSFAIAARGPDVPDVVPLDRGLAFGTNGPAGITAVVPPPVTVQEVANPAAGYVRQLRVRIGVDDMTAPAISPADVARLSGVAADPPLSFVGRWPGRSAPDATHGTSVAGVLAADTGNGFGMAGASGPSTPVELSGLVLEGNSGDAAIATAVRHASRDLRAHVVNISLGWGHAGPPPNRAKGPGADPALPSLTNAAFGAVGADSRTLFVVAAGNESGDLNRVGPRNDTRRRQADWVDWEPCRPKGDGVTRRPALPGGQPASRGGTLSFLQMPDGTYDRGNVLCVGATDRNGNVSTFSNWGAGVVDLAAPGTDVVVPVAAPESDLGTQFAVSSGTSYSAPMVAGIAALVYHAAGDSARPWLVKCALMSAATSRSLRAPDSRSLPFTAYGAVPNGRPFTVHGVPLAAEAVSAAGALRRKIATALAAASTAGATPRYPTCVQKRRAGLLGGAWRDTPVRTR